MAPNPSRRGVALGIGAAAVATAVGAGWYVTRPGPAPAPAPTPDQAAAPAPGPAAALPPVPDLVLGNPDAKVTVTEYASFTCPHCARFHAEVFKPLKRDYIDTGRVRFVYREVFFDRYGLWAALVARCGGEMRYFGIADLIYAGQREWSGSNDPAVVAGNLRRLGLSAGLTGEMLDACLSDAAMAQALMARFEATAREDGIESTPTLLINGQKHGNMGYAELARLIDAALAE
jgi:protein-disulfide isomerase